jgi:putative protease
MATSRTIELLAPAKNLECGIEAIRHGADAVYIGAPRFGARASAGNSLEDIAELSRFAHIFGAKVYVTMNTILTDEQLPEAEAQTWELYRAGVDALIVQDMAFKRLHLPPIELHASTQMDNRTPEKVRFLAGQGFTQVVLARELSLEEIREIHRVVEVPLEVFVHGALCVSYSGQCYASQHCFGRSANRGECAQFCRLKFDLEDAEGAVIERDKYLLSLKDMNQGEHLEELLDAGASSLKIEGRLKDVSYVKNVVAWYRLRLDEIFKRRREYVRASHGEVRILFDPKPEKSFNRGFTHYFLKGRVPNIFSMNTPKSLGEFVGTVKEVKNYYFTVAGVTSFANGDGLCFMDARGSLHGFRANRVENNRVFPQSMPEGLRAGLRLYRNFDKVFEDTLAHASAERKMGVRMVLEEVPVGFRLSVTDELGRMGSAEIASPKEVAKRPQEETIRRALSKLGGTEYALSSLEIRLGDAWFIPASLLTELRRAAVEALELHVAEVARGAVDGARESVDVSCGTVDGACGTVDASRKGDDVSVRCPEKISYLGNVANRLAKEFWMAAGAKEVAPAFELEEPREAVLMFCKHCLRFSLGWCVKNGGERSPYREPYYLRLPDGRRFRLDFDCKNCQMKVVKV